MEASLLFASNTVRFSCSEVQMTDPEALILLFLVLELRLTWRRFCCLPAIKSGFSCAEAQTDPKYTNIVDPCSELR